MIVEVNKKEDSKFDNEYIENIKHITEFTEEQLVNELTRRETLKRFKIEKDDADNYYVWDKTQMIRIYLKHPNGFYSNNKEYLKALIDTLNSHFHKSI